MQHGRLTNGLRFILIESPSASTATVAIRVQVGAYQVFYHIIGIAHLIEHLAFHGNDVFSETELYSNIYRHRGTLNAKTMEDYTLYYATLDPDGLLDALQVVSSMISTVPHMSDESIAREQEILHNELDNESTDNQNPTEYARSQLYQLIEPNDKQAVENNMTNSPINVELVSTFLQQFYVPNQMVLCITCPEINPNLLDWIESYFDFNAGIQNRQSMGPTVNEHKHQATISRLQHRSIQLTNVSGSTEAYIAIGFPIHKTKHLAVVDLIGIMLAGTMISILTTQLRRDNGLVYHIDYQLNRQQSIFSIHTFTHNSVDLVNRVVDAILNQLFHFPLLTVDQLDVFKQYYLGQLQQTIDNSELLALSILEQRECNVKQMIHQVEQIQPLTVQRIAQRIFQLNRANVVVVH